MSKRSALSSWWVMLWTEYSQHCVITHHMVGTEQNFRPLLFCCHSYPSYFPHRAFLSFDVISLDSTRQHPTVKTSNGIAITTLQSLLSHLTAWWDSTSWLPSGTSRVMFKVIWFGSVAVTATEKAASLASLLFDDGFAALNWAKIFPITVMVYQQVPTPFFRAFGNDSYFSDFKFGIKGIKAWD